MLTRRDFLSASAAATASAALIHAQAARRPNFIVILTDDQGYGDFGANGAADIRTPNLDRLAATGVRFTDWHATSPVCSPSRASVITGKYPQRAGIPEVLNSRPTFDVPGLKAGETSLARELRNAGYSTAAVGKWHLGSASHSRPLAQGFDQFYGFYSGWIDYYSQRYYTLAGNPGQTGPVPPAIFHDFWNNADEIHPEPEYQTELLGRKARDFVASQSTGKPFFLYLTFGAPHYPMMAPEKYRERFPASMDRDRRLHAAMIAAIDDAVGGLTEELKRRGHDNNTLIFYQSDNGATEEIRGDHKARPYRGGSNGKLKGWKGSLWEGGHRVPALMNFPGRIAPRVVESAGMGMDVLPTLLGFAGVNAPQGVDGADLSQALTGKSAWPDRTLHWEYSKQRAVRRGEWKLLRDPRPSLNGPNEP